MDSLVIFSSFSHARLTKLAALIQKSVTPDVKEVTVKIIKLGYDEILEGLQGTNYYIIVSRTLTDELIQIQNKLEVNDKKSGKIFTFEQIDNAIKDPNGCGVLLCSQIF